MAEVARGAAIALRAVSEDAKGQPARETGCLGCEIEAILMCAYAEAALGLRDIWISE